MLNADADLPMEEDVSTRPVPAASPLAEALRRGAGVPAARVVVTAVGSPAAFAAFAVGNHRIAPMGDSLEPPLDQLAAALAVPEADIAVTAATDADVVEALAEASIDLDLALGQAGAMADAWHDVLALVPDGRATVRLAPSLPPGGAEVDDEQWRILARIGGGRPVGELAPLLELGQLAAMQAVHALAVVGLVSVTAAPRVLTAPPAPPAPAAFAPPALPPPGAASFPAPAAPLAPLAGFAPPAPVATDDVAAPVTSDAPTPEAAPTEPPDETPAAEHAWAEDETTAPDAWSTDTSPAPAVADEWGVTPTEIEATTWDDEPTPSVRPDPAIADAWGDDDWDTAEPALPATADLWADDAPAATAPTVATPVAPARPASARPVAPLASFDRDAVAPRPPDIDPPIAPADDFGSSANGDDELVNRALLFKFLSSMRD